MLSWFIGNFSNIRSFKSANIIPISTCQRDPGWYSGYNGTGKGYTFSKAGILLGIREESFLLSGNSFEQLEEHCQPDCPWKYKNPNCGFLKAYRAHLDTIDFNWLLSEFNRVAEDVRKITHYEGDPIIVLLVWEAASNPCSERGPIKEFFAKHGIELKDWSK